MFFKDSFFEVIKTLDSLCKKKKHTSFHLPFPKQQILVSSKLKEIKYIIADDNFKLYENGRKFYTQVENTVGKGVKSNFSFFPSVFKILVLQTHKKQGLFGKGLNSHLASATTLFRSLSVKTLYHTISTFNDPIEGGF